MDIKTIAVIGAGQMGNGIAQVAAQAGYSVIMNDIADEFVERGVSTITKNLDKKVKKGKMDADDRDAVLGRITGSVTIEDAKDADFVIEAAIEREDLKKEIFVKLDAICRPEVILATNTSSISISRIAAATKRPEKVIGMHFMNPVPVMKLVEIIRGIATSEETFRLRFRTSVTGVRRVEFVVLVFTPPGEAQLIGRLLDSASLDGLAGTLAGDDTVICVAGSASEARALESRLTQMLV